MTRHLFEEALRQNEQAHREGDALRKACANTAAWLLSYSPTSRIAEESPLVYELMQCYGTSLLDGLLAARDPKTHRTNAPGRG